MQKRMTLALSLSTSFAALAFAPAIASAQQLDLPRPSPNATLKQTVGLTDITVEYSCPGVKGRKIWGGVVAYGKPWRTGANATTKITFSKDVTVGGKAVPAGTYGLFTIPNEKSWTVILTTPTMPALGYTEGKDTARFEVAPVAAPMRERMGFQFASFDEAGAELDLEWEKLRLPIAIGVATDAQTAEAIKQYEESTWVPPNMAARYELDHKRYDQGLALVEKSLGLRETWWNTFTKAQLLAGKGQKKEALALAEKADQLGQAAKAKKEQYFAEDEVKGAITEWKKK